MSRSFLALCPALQAVWTATYAAALPIALIFAHQIKEGASGMVRGEQPSDAAAHDAEACAWEAVRRANGGAVPGVMPCAHDLVDLLVAGDGVTKCGRCCEELQARREEAAKPDPCSRCKGRPSEFGDLCAECDADDHGDRDELEVIKAQKGILR